MYTGADLNTLQTALNALTANGLLQYDLDIGSANPSLQIYVPKAQLAAFSFFPPASKERAAIANLYATKDFTPPVATFISNFQTAVQNAVKNNAALLAQINQQVTSWSTFQTAYNALGAQPS